MTENIAADNLTAHDLLLDRRDQKNRPFQFEARQLEGLSFDDIRSHEENFLALLEQDLASIEFEVAQASVKNFVDRAKQALLQAIECEAKGRDWKELAVQAINLGTLAEFALEMGQNYDQIGNELLDYLQREPITFNQECLLLQLKKLILKGVRIMHRASCVPLHQAFGLVAEMTDPLDEQFTATAEKFYLNKWDWKAIFAGNKLLLTAGVIACAWLLFVTIMH